MFCAVHSTYNIVHDYLFLSSFCLYYHHHAFSRPKLFWICSLVLVQYSHEPHKSFFKVHGSLVLLHPTIVVNAICLFTASQFLFNNCSLHCFISEHLNKIWLEFSPFTPPLTRQFYNLHSKPFWLFYLQDNEQECCTASDQWMQHYMVQIMPENWSCMFNVILNLRDTQVLLETLLFSNPTLF